MASTYSIGGYPKYSSFGAVVGTRSDAGRDEFLAYHKAAICAPGPATDRVAEIARDHGVFIVSGLIERDGGTLYCSVGFWSPAEGLVYKRRKVHGRSSVRGLVE
jgi:predicted amidohydrolase